MAVGAILIVSTLVAPIALADVAPELAAVSPLVCLGSGIPVLVSGIHRRTHGNDGLRVLGENQRRRRTAGLAPHAGLGGGGLTFVVEL
ncbi:MAG: hypothetical protein ACI8PZ_005286 [Myxococcota bacterium]